MIADPALSGTIAARWSDVQNTLRRQLDSTGTSSVEITVLSWNGQSGSLSVKSRTVPKQLVRARVFEVLGDWTQLPRITRTDFEKLVLSLAGMVSNGS